MSILLGLFSSGHSILDHSLILQVHGPSQLSLLIPTQTQPKPVSITTRTPLQTGKRYRLEFESTGPLGTFHAVLADPSEPFNPLFRSEQLSVPSVSAASWDELGGALSEISSAPTAPGPVGQYRLLKVSFRR